MKKKDLQELHGKTKAELLKLVEQAQLDIANLRMSVSEGKVKNVNEIRTKMKNCARMLTLIGNKTREEKLVESKLTA